MNRRSILAALASLPFVGALVPKAKAGLRIAPWPGASRGDGVALTSMAHPWPEYAKAGEVVTCVNGHTICEFACDATTGEMFRREHLTNWQQDEPQIGGPIPRCACCGGRFYLGGNIFHIGDSWRDPNGIIAKYGMPRE